MSARIACAILCLGLVTISAKAFESFSFDDIHYWIGVGTNRAGIVIDWNNGRPNSSLAWGIRWNGASTNLANLTKVLQDLAHQDRRLHVSLKLGDGGYGTAVRGFAYDVNNSGGFFDMSVPGAATDAKDFITTDNFTTPLYWALTAISADSISVGQEWEYASSGVNGVFPVDGDWYAFKCIASAWPATESSTPALPVAAETPFAYVVRDYRVGPYENFTNAYAVLGAPSRMTGIEEDALESPAPVSPGLAAMHESQVLSLSMTEDDSGDWPGYVTVAFDHRVMDHPQNPYGLDFIVFGNAWQDLGGAISGHEDPASIIVPSPDLFAEPGIVAVSQDGETWFEYTEGPFADTFAPTLGYLYDTNSPDASLFEGNQWWGRPADPTLPIDPALTSTNFVGKTLAEYATLYNGSAGGTGFDISRFDLPVDPETGLKWIQYVRVTGGSNTEDAEWTEVDAFAVVSPALPYDNWVREHYAWTDLPDQSVTGKDVIAANGKPNFYNAAFGIAPEDTQSDERFSITAFSVEDGRAIFRVPSAAVAYDAFRIGKASILDGVYRNRLPVYEGAVTTDTGFESVFSIPVDADAEKAFYKIGISAK